MARSGRSAPRKVEAKAPVIVQNSSTVNSVLARSAEVGNNDLPIRTVLYIEVGDLPATQVRQVVSHVMDNLSNGHPHHVAVMRNGKVTSDVEFEGEFLHTVRQLCEIKDGEITLKGGAKEMEVIRRSV